MDCNTALAISKFNGQPFCDAGGKYHKISRMHVGLHYSYRPLIIPADTAYVQAHPRSKYPNAVITHEAWSTSTIFPVNNLLSVDSIYYPGVFEAIANTLSKDNSTQVYVVMNSYN